MSGKDCDRIAALGRLLKPKRVALIGGKWADAALTAARAIGYEGVVWRVDPSRSSTREIRYFRSVDELPESPDAAFVAAPNHEVPGIAAALVRRGAGGFVCFASGFSELGTADGKQLGAALSVAAGGLPYFGPNCYGFVNFFDRVALWPDQVVGSHVDRGVAIICQSGTIALNIMFNRRSVPIGYIITVGNQSCLTIEEIVDLLVDDARVTAFGLYVEGIRDMDGFTRAAARAKSAGKPIVLIKAGHTPAAERTVHSHTGALAGEDRAFDAFCRAVGIARCDSLSTLCETLKVLHVAGPLHGPRILVMGASGGDMAMAADAARDLSLTFPALSSEATATFRRVLGPHVSISNPFDFHTYVWFDRHRLHELFSTAHRAGYDATSLMIDCPPPDAADPSSYLNVIDEFINAFPKSDGASSCAAIISSLPESLLAAASASCFTAGIVPLQGQREALEALNGAAAIGQAWGRGAGVALIKSPRAPGGAAGVPGVTPEARRYARSLTEQESKRVLAEYGVRVPRSMVVDEHSAAAAAREIGFPVVIKVAGEIEHKSEIGGVVLNVRTEPEAIAAAGRLRAVCDRLLIEEMVTDGIAEILIGVKADPQFGLLLVLGAGGVLAELIKDTVVLLPPFTSESILSGIRRLRVWKLLDGYRGRPLGDVAALLTMVSACARYAEKNVDDLLELDVNPAIVRRVGCGAVAVDALIRIAQET